jgi:hypothetical protein
MNNIDGRQKKFGAVLNDIEDKLDSVTFMLGDFMTGPRMLFLMNRTKDGGGTSEEKRIISAMLYRDEVDFKSSLKEMMVLKETLYPLARVYLSVNKRDIFKSIRTLEQMLLDAHYSPEDSRLDVYTKLLRSTRTCVMQPSNRAQTMFLIDIDDDEPVGGKRRDKDGEALGHLAELGVRVIDNRKTKNGWHIITEPFNPALWDNTLGEVKKDALLCILW